jgi:hypothetical protein
MRIHGNTDITTPTELFFETKYYRNSMRIRRNTEITTPTGLFFETNYYCKYMRIRGSTDIATPTELFLDLKYHCKRMGTRQPWNLSSRYKCFVFFNKKNAPKTPTPAVCPLFIAQKSSQRWSLPRFFFEKKTREGN